MTLSLLDAVRPAVIRLDDVSKSYALPDGGRFHAVTSTSLQVRSGDIFGLIGKSGAGKSTLLRLINMLERPDTGSVWVDGNELTTLNKTALRRARQSIGMIFQHFNLMKNATVFDNVAFPLKIHTGLRGAALSDRVYQCLEVVGLEAKAHSFPSKLSGGQKQRVAIARALASRPSVLLCDEPTSALDSETTRSVLQTLQDINKQLGVTIVIVTHELPVVHALCRHVAVIEDGQVAEQFELGNHNYAPWTGLGKELRHYGRFLSLMKDEHQREAQHA